MVPRGWQTKFTMLFMLMMQFNGGLQWKYARSVPQKHFLRVTAFLIHTQRWFIDLGSISAG